MFNPVYFIRVRFWYTLIAEKFPFLLLGFFLLTIGPSGWAQQIRIDFVHQFEATVVDMAIGPNGHLYLLNNDATVTRIDTLHIKGTMDLSERGRGHAVGRSQCVAIDTRENIFLGDAANGRILVFDRKGKFLRQFGSSYDSEKKLSEPTGLTFDSYGRLFVADKKGAVFVFNDQGVFMGKLSGLNQPIDVGVDRSGHIYVLEAKEVGIHVFDQNLELLTVMRPGDDIRFVLSSPGGMFVEWDGTVYVTDIENCAIYILRAALEPESGLTYYTQMGVKGEGRGEFRNPVAVAADNRGFLYVADDKNRDVQIFSMVGLHEVKVKLHIPSERSLPTVVEWIADIDHTHMADSRGLRSFSLDNEGNMYLLDADLSSVSVYTWAGSYVMSFGGEGTDPGRMKKPVGIVWNEDKFLYVNDTGNHRIQLWSDTGVFQRQFGKKGKGMLEFNSPRAAVLDANNYLYIADTNNDRIQGVSTEGKVISIIRGDEIDPLRKPIDVAIGPRGKIYVVEEERRTVKVFEQSGRLVSVIGDEESGPFQEPISVAADTSGNVYVLDARTGVHVFDREYRPIVHFASHGDQIGQFHQLTHIQIGPEEKMYILDSEHSRVSIFRLANRSEGAVAGSVEPVPEKGLVTLFRHGQSVPFDSLQYDGSFFLKDVPPGDCEVRIEAFGYFQCKQETVHVVPGRVVQSERIILEANGLIDGVLIPSVSGARVRLKKDVQYLAEATVHPIEGSFVFPDIRPGEYEIEVQAEGFVSRRPPTKVEVSSGDVVKDTTYLKRPGSIEGIVTPPDVGALVTVFQGNVDVARTAVRSGTGTFGITNLYPERYTLVIRAPDYLDRTVENIDVREGFRLDVGLIELQRAKSTTPQARYLIGEGKRLHLTAEFEQAQTFFLEAITTQEMTNHDLAEAYLWLAYSYFPFPEHATKMEDALKKAIQLDPERMPDESFSPDFRTSFKTVKERLLEIQEE